MSTATLVPETYGLDGDDARVTLERAQFWQVARDAFVRFRYADGFSYARAMAFQLVLTLIPGVIFVVALSVRMGEGRLRSILSSMIDSLAPGPAGEVFRQAFSQGSNAASAGNTVAIVTGALAMIIAAVTGMSQLQRGSSRIYGVLADRPTLHRYGLATVLALTAGFLLTVAFVMIALGDSVRGSFEDELSTVWSWLRWPVGLLTLGVGLAALFKAAPNRRQPRLSWLITGGAISVLGWFAVSAILAGYLNVSSAFGETYGPLAGVIGVLLWGQLSSIAILYGLAFAAQLEAVRAGIEEPRTKAPEQPTPNQSTNVEQVQAVPA